MGAAGLGISHLALDLKGLFKNAFGGARDSVQKEKTEIDADSITFYDQLDAYNEFTISENETVEKQELDFETEIEEIPLASLEDDSPFGALVKKFQKEKVKMGRKAYLLRIVKILEDILTEDEKLVAFIENAKKEITSFDLSKIDLSNITDKESPPFAVAFS